MNIFKKALIVALSIGLISVPTVTKEVEAADDRVLYLNAGGSGLWDQANAKFQAWIWGGDESGRWVSFEDPDDDGIYTSTSLIQSYITEMHLYRRDPKGADNDFDSYWNKCSHVAINSEQNCVTITNWDKASASTFYYNVVGSFTGSNWSDNASNSLTYNFEKKEHYIENFSLSAGDEFKVKRSGSWDNSFGYGKLEKGNTHNLSGSDNVRVTNDAYYDIYYKSNGSLFIQQKYLVSFVVDTEESGVQYVKYDEGTFDKEDPIKDGYTFAGWFTSVDSNGKGVGTPYFSNSSSNKITSNVTLYAGWTQELTFTVSFNDNNGNISNTTVVDGEKISEPTTPTRTGFKFVGWYTSENEKYDFETSVTEDLSLYAKWEYAPIIGTKNYIYFENTFGWTNVNCYAWDSNGNNASWPGKPMTKLNDTTYCIEYDSNHTNLIFNDGSEQTGDLTYNGNYYSGETVATVSGSERDFDSSIYFQNKIGTKENTSKVRFVGSLGTGDMTFDLSKYNEVGFILGSTVDGIYKTAIKTTTNVYTSVEVNGSTVTAANLESPADYVYLITVDNVPQGQTFDVTTYAVDAEGNTVYGKTKTIYVYYEA